MALTKVSGPLLHGSNNNLGNYVINNITGAAATFTSLDCSNIDLSADDLKIVGIITNSVLTPGTVVWVGTGNTLTESDNLTWDNTNVRLKNLGITSTKNLNVTGISTFGATVYMADKLGHLTDTDTAIRFPALDTATVETGGSERLRCDSDGVKAHNGRFYSAGTFAYIESSSASNATLTLRKTHSNADSIDYLQLRNNANDLKLKVSGDGIIFSPDVLASHEGDSDTQIRFPAADTFTVETGGSERIRFDSAGKTFIHGTGATGSNNTSTRLPNGNTLNVHGTSSNDGISVVRYSDSYGCYGINIAKSNNDTLGTNTLVTDNEDLGHITFYGADGTDFNHAAQITAQVDGTPSDGTDMPGALLFKTSPEASATPVEVMRITSGGTTGGQVLLGGNTSYNESKSLLSVQTDNAGGANMLSNSSALYNHTNPAFLHIANRYNTGTGQEAGIILHSKNSQNGSWAIYSKRTSTGYLADLIFRNRTASAASAERLRIDSTGRISSGKHGVGTYNDASEWFKVQSNDSAANISIVGSNDTHSSLNLGDEDDFNIQKIRSDHTDNSLQFFTNDTEKLRITSDGNTTTDYNIKCNNLRGRNLIINGAMTIAQRATTISVEGYSVDRFNYLRSGINNELTLAQHALTSSDAGPWEEGFRHSLHFQNGDQSAGGAGASDYAIMRYKVEAQDLANCGWNYNSATSYLTLSYWIRSSVSQKFPAYLRTHDGTARVFSWDTGTLSANTWTKITQTIPGHSGITINNDNGIGMLITFPAYWGGTWTDNNVTYGNWRTWASGNERIKDYETGWWTTNNATLEITGVQLELGSVATPFEHLTYAEDLRNCQRYFYKSPTGGYYVGAGNGTTNLNNTQFTFPVAMRAEPGSMDAVNIMVVTDSNYTTNNSKTPTIGNWSEMGCNLNWPSVTGTTDNRIGAIMLNGAAARVAFDCEL